MMLWHPVIDRGHHPRAAIDRTLRSRREHRPARRHEHRRESAVPGARRCDRPTSRKASSSRRTSPYGSRSTRRSPPIARRIQAPARRPARSHSRQTGPAHPRHPPADAHAKSARPPNVRVCLALRRSLADALARAMRSRSVRLRHARKEPNCSGERTRHSSWQTPCTRPGSLLPRMGPGLAKVRSQPQGNHAF